MEEGRRGLEAWTLSQKALMLLALTTSRVVIYNHRVCALPLLLCSLLICCFMSSEIQAHSRGWSRDQSHNDWQLILLLMSVWQEGAPGL